MFLPRASARSRAAALGVLCFVACTARAMERAKAHGSTGRAPLAEPASLSPVEERRAEALAEYATGVSEEIKGNLIGALDRYHRVLQLDPHNTALAIRLGQIYATKREITNAVSVLESSARANPGNAEVSYWLGFVYRSDNQNEKATAAFRQALKIDPNHLSAVGGLLDIHMLQDSPTEAVKMLDHAFHQKVEASSYWSRLGDFYAAVYRQKPTWARQIDRKRIQQCYEKALASAPGDSDIEMRLADAYADNGNPQKAADSYSRLLAKNPDAPLIRERLAANYIRGDQKEKAAAVLEEIIKREPLAYGIYNDLGELYADLGKTEKAIFNYQQSLVVKPNQPENYAQITALQLDSKQIDQALGTLATWKAKFPTDFRVPYFTGLIQTDRKQFADAVASFADAESLAQELPDEGRLTSKFYFSYGAACERSGNPDKAVALFRKCLQLDPEDHTACNYLGFMWAEKGVNLEEALGLIQKAVKLEPENGAYIDSLGWVLYKLGRDEEALVQLRRAVELVKDDPVVFEHLADVLLKLGKTDEAIAVLRRACELDPGNKGISEKLQKLKNNQSAAH
jgi:tetratricopeptide (TPR) repeat protein